jgi:hypothetical protein
MKKELLIYNILNSLEELSYYESKNEDDMILLVYKDLHYYFTKLNYDIAVAFLKEMQKD